MRYCRLLSQQVAGSDGAVDTLRLKDEAEVADPVDVTGWARKIQPEHASWARDGGPGMWLWRQGLSPACGGADARIDHIAAEPAAVLVSVVSGEPQRARIAGPRDVDLKTDAYDREPLGQDVVIDQNAVRAAAAASTGAGADIGDLVPSLPIRVRTVDSGAAEVSERDRATASYLATLSALPWSSRWSGQPISRRNAPLSSPAPVVTRVTGTFGTKWHRPGTAPPR